MKRRVATTWEELRKLEGFRPSVDRKELAYATVVGQYAMPTIVAMQPCGINQCRTKHRNGFIVELANGDVSHVGGHCGKKHFGTANWKVRLRAYRQASEVEAQARALSELRLRAEHLLSSSPVQPAELPAVREMLAAFDLIAPSVKDSLVAKAQDRDPRITRSRPPSEKEIRDAKFYGKPAPSQVTETVGMLIGLAAILRSNRADYLWDVVIPAALDSVRKSLGGSADDISVALREYNAAFVRLDSSIRSALEFFSEKNLTQLPLLPRARALGFRGVTIRTGPKFCIELN